MNSLGSGLLEFWPDTVEAVRKEINLEKPGRVDEAVDILEEWVKMQNHFVKKDFPRIYLETTLLSVKGSIERAKQKLDKLCTFKTLMPEFFPSNITKHTFAPMKDIFYQACLPKLTKEHNRVYLMNITTDEINSSVVHTFIKYGMVLCEFLKRNDYNAGIIAILDYRDINILNYITRISPMDIKRFTTLVTEGYSFRVKSIHVLSNSKVVESLFTLLKQIVSAKLGGRIQLHNNLDTLHEVVEKDLLPVDYGGKEKPLKDLSDELLEVLCGKDNAEFVQEMYKAKTDETRRQADVFNENYLGISGSFRVLSVD